MTLPPALSTALRLAARGRFGVAPNPMVGAVVDRDGAVVGFGYHQEVGGPHAEVLALRAAGELARGATLYVTLEPCSHHGRTPPCVEAILEAGIRRVVACHRDPNPQVAGQGFRRLRRAGLAVEVGPGREEAVRLNWRYLVSHLLERPAVTVKWAMSLDGRIATTRGESRWISSPAARRWSLDLRETHDAILIGVGTALADDPRLTRRRGKASGPILRVVLDRRLRLPADAALLREKGPVLLYTEAGSGDSSLQRTETEVVALEAVTPQRVVADLHRRGVQSLLVEGGGEILGSFVRARLFDRVAADVAPLLLGGREAPAAVGGEGFAALAEAPRLESVQVRRRGEDVIVMGFRQGCLRDLSASVAG